MRKVNKNGISLISNEKNILRFGDLSSDQRHRGIKVDHTQVYIKCEDCDKELLANKRNNNGDLQDGTTFLRKSQVTKDENGYFIQGGIEFYCSDCQRKN